MPTETYDIQRDGYRRQGVRQWNSNFPGDVTGSETITVPGNAPQLPQLPRLSSRSTPPPVIKR